MKYPLLLTLAALVCAVFMSVTQADETTLFNGKNLDGWSFKVREDEQVKDINVAWQVKNGLLVATGLGDGYLLHEGEFENYVLTLDWRWMRLEGNGIAVSGSGALYLHTIDEEGRFYAPKSIEVSLDSIGNVFLRDVDLSEMGSMKWAFTAPNFADDVEREMGEWNSVKVIANGDRLTVIANGTPVNYVENINRTKGAVALKTFRGTIAAPTYYRNLVLRPITDADRAEEQRAAAQFNAQRAAEQRQREAEEAQRVAEMKAEEMKQESLAKEWASVEVTSEIAFKADARYLPFPKDAQEMQFMAPFEIIRFTSPSSLQTLSDFYRTEMAKRGWQLEETDIEDDSVEIVYKHGDAEVELELDQGSDECDIDMDCEGLAFEGTNDPAGLVALGVPQPKGYLYLQKVFQMPEGVQGLHYDLGYRCVFKCPLKLQETFDFFTQQLRKQGFRETRRPILNDDRRYTEFAKGNVELSVNIFTDEVGSRGILSYEEE